MTKNELVIALNDFDDDDTVIISDGEGWANIESVGKPGPSIVINMEMYPVFSDNSEI